MISFFPHHTRMNYGTASFAVIISAMATTVPSTQCASCIWRRNIHRQYDAVYIVPLLEQLRVGTYPSRTLFGTHCTPHYARFYSTQRKRSTYAYAFNGNADTLYIGWAYLNPTEIIIPSCVTALSVIKRIWHNTVSRTGIVSINSLICSFVSSTAIGWLLTRTLFASITDRGNCPRPLYDAPCTAVHSAWLLDSLFALHQLLQDTIDAPLILKTARSTMTSQTVLYFLTVGASYRRSHLRCKGWECT